MIIATDIYNGYSKDNNIPWEIKKDMMFFKKITSTCAKDKRNAVIMGRKTFESIGLKPLKNRLNIIISSKLHNIDKEDKEDKEYKEYIISSSISNAISSLDTYNIDKVFIIGGLNIYIESLQKLNIYKIYKTVIYHNFNCDGFFIDLNNYNYKIESFHDEIDDIYKIRFETWIKNI